MLIRQRTSRFIITFSCRNTSINGANSTANDSFHPSFVSSKTNSKPSTKRKNSRRTMSFTVRQTIFSVAFSPEHLTLILFLAARKHQESADQRDVNLLSAALCSREYGTCALRRYRCRHDNAVVGAHFRPHHRAEKSVDNCSLTITCPFKPPKLGSQETVSNR